jgi:hypothetical protein
MMNFFYYNIYSYIAYFIKYNYICYIILYKNKLVKYFLSKTYYYIFFLIYLVVFFWYEVLFKR